MSTTNQNQEHNDVQEYYGKVLSSKDDLQTTACCLAEQMPEYLKTPLKLIHDDIMSKFYGCGSPIPFALEGQTVLDLGCGTGRDVYLLSHLVGESGKVIGVDMTEEQLMVARQHQKYHADKFGFKQSNVEFKHGYIEDLNTLGISDNSVDLVISNCVLNLSPKKKEVFSEIFRVLKPGGELYFSDVFSAQRIPTELLKDPVLLGECLSGAMYFEDFRRMLEEFGCSDYRTVSCSTLEVTNPAIAKKIGMIDFYSATVRAFKLDLEDRCENFGHVATYQGTINETPHFYNLDDHHTFKKGLATPVCGNTAKMLSETRLQKHFTVTGDFNTHYGLFDCSPTIASPATTSSTAQNMTFANDQTTNAGSCC